MLRETSSRSINGTLTHLETLVIALFSFPEYAAILKAPVPSHWHSAVQLEGGVSGCRCSTIEAIEKCFRGCSINGDAVPTLGL